MTKASRVAARPRSAKPLPQQPSGLEVVAIALAMLGPVAIMPGALNRFVFVKVALVVVGCAAAFSASVVARGRLPRLVVVLMVAGGLMLLAAALASASPLSSILGRGPRYEGVFVLGGYALATAMGARLFGPQRSPVSANLAVRLLALAAIVVGIVAVFETLGLRPLSTDVARPGSLFGNASDEGAWAVLVLGPLAASALRDRNRWSVVGTLAAAVTVALSASRGALVAVFVVAIVLAIGEHSWRGRSTLAGGLCAVIGLAFAVPATAARVVGSSPLANATVHGRLSLWGETLRLIAHHPIFGVGPSGFEDAVVAEHTLGWQETVGPANPPDGPHSWPLQVLSAGGAVLMVVVLAVVVLLVIRGARALRAPVVDALSMAGVVAGLAGYSVALLVHLTSPGPTCAAAVFAGALFAEPVTGRHPLRWQRIGVVATARALVVVLVFAALAEIPLRAAIVAMEKGRISRAQADFHAARLLRPWDVEVDLAAGHAFAADALGGDPAAVGYGLSWLEPVGSRVPGSEQYAEDLAALREAAGNYAAAAALLENALRRDANNPLILLRLGVLDAEQGKPDAAERAFLQVTRITPASPDPWQDLAVLYTKLGRTADSARANARARQLQGG